MRRLLVLACVALLTSGCSEAKKTVDNHMGAADAKVTCAVFAKVVDAQKSGAMNAAQIRAQIFTMAADLATDAVKDPKLQPVADAFAKMSDAIKAGDAAATQQYSEQAAQSCNAILTS